MKKICLIMLFGLLVPSYTWGMEEDFFAPSSNKPNVENDDFFGSASNKKMENNDSFGYSQQFFENQSLNEEEKRKKRHLKKFQQILQQKIDVTVL